MSGNFKEPMEVAIPAEKKSSGIWSIGLAMFAMFFGAGNIVFPLAVGLFSQDKNVFGVLGMTITAVLVPLAGLLAMMLYEGDYNAFFRRIGKLPGFIVTLMILGLIGPFGGIPRCITISYSTLNAFGLEHIPGMNLAVFSLLSCLLIFFFTFRPNKIVSLLGYVLTPLLLLSLFLVAVIGLWKMPGAQISTHTGFETFTHGLVGGYNTMDLLASFFFSSVVLLCVKKGNDKQLLADNKQLLNTAIFGSLVAAFLLTLVYVSFSFLAAGCSSELQGLAGHEILGKLAYLHLGPSAGLVAGTVVAFACLTTEIALAAILAQFLRKTLCKEKISYEWSLVIILAISAIVSTLRFEGISTFLVPILQVCYPALIVLTLCNIAHKLYGLKIVKSLVYGTFALSLLGYFLR